LVWARLMSEGRAAGKPRSDLDMIVAAVAETNECVIVTDNEKHFSGLDVLNPLRKPP
jgi:predicted nucleic acid-binding protein